MFNFGSFAPVKRLAWKMSLKYTIMSWVGC